MRGLRGGNRIDSGGRQGRPPHWAGAAAAVLLLGLLVAAPAFAWDRGVRARGALRAADRLYNKHAYREALEKYRTYIEQRGPGDADTLARAWTQLGECAEKAGRYREALDARATALGLYLRKDDQAGIAETLRKMGEAHAFRGSYDESLRIIELARAVPGGASDDRRRAGAYRSLAVTYGALGRYREQSAAAQAALELYRKLGDAGGESSAWNSLAIHHQTQGRFAEAEEAAGKALEAARRATIPDLAPVYLTMAGIHRARGNLREASRTDEVALDEARKTGVVEAAAVAQANLGLDAMAFGEYSKAREALEEALAKFADCGATDDQARMHLELGRVSYFEQSWPRALTHLDAAARLFSASNQPVAVAVVDAARGRVLGAAGQPAESLAALDRALAAFREAGEAAGVASAAVERGFALSALGRHSEALAALQIAEQGKGEADVAWRILQGRARVAAVSGDIGGAIASYGRAAEAIEALLTRARVPEFRSSFLGGGDRLEVYDEAIELLARGGRAQDALEFAERSRARAFLDLMSAGRIDLRAGGDAELLAQERTLRERILNLSTRTGQIRGGGDDLDSQLLATRDEYHRLLERLAGQSPALANLLAVKPVGGAALRSSLGASEQVLYYHVGSRTPRVFVVTRTSVTATPIATKPRELRALAAVFRIQLEQRIPSEKMARELHRLLLGPVQGRLKSGPVTVAAHDMLHYVPFQALLDDTGKYLLEHRAVRYTPSLSALAALSGRSAGTGVKLVAAGAPAAGPAVPALPKATEEVQRVSSHFPGATALTGAAATEAAVKQAAPSGDILHFACHGLLDPDLPLYSGLALTPGGGDDGRLELHEIFGMRLKADLVVLSACQTALGALSRGDELVCLARSFLYAGSSSVLASLWSVPDESTALMMDRFYAAMRKGAPRDRALREAALSLIADPKYSEPYFWSAFCLMGRS